MCVRERQIHPLQPTILIQSGTGRHPFRDGPQCHAWPSKLPSTTVPVSPFLSFLATSVFYFPLGDADTETTNRDPGLQPDRTPLQTDLDFSSRASLDSPSYAKPPSFSLPTRRHPSLHCGPDMGKKGAKVTGGGDMARACTSHGMHIAREGSSTALF